MANGSYRTTPHRWNGRHTGMTKFRNSEASHQHSLQIINTFYEFDDFMESIGTLCDLGAGACLDAHWWATAKTRDLNNSLPLDIKVTAVDIKPKPNWIKDVRNLTHLQQDIEQPLAVGKRQFDIMWCHDVFQYMTNPMQTLRYWRDATADDGMLVLSLPQTTNLEFNTQAFDLPSGVYYHWTLVSLIHVLAVNGWDCSSGFFRKNQGDPWLHAVVYKSEQAPLDPKTTTWYELAERGLLPTSAAAGVNRHGYLRQRDLVLPWLDKSLMDYSHH